MPHKPNKTSSKQSARLYTFRVLVTFEMQYTFRSDEVECDPDGAANSLEPTDKALTGLGNELREYLSQNYAVDNVEVSSDSDFLLGVNDAPSKQKF